MVAEKTACLPGIMVGYVADKFRKLYIHRLFNMEEIEVKLSFHFLSVVQPHLLILQEREGFRR